MNITDLKEQTRAAVIAHLLKTGRSQRKFAVNAGVDWSDFNKWLKGTKNFNDKSVDLIIKQLRYETGDNGIREFEYQNGKMVINTDLNIIYVTVNNESSTPYYYDKDITVADIMEIKESHKLI